MIFGVTGVVLPMVYIRLVPLVCDVWSAGGVGLCLGLVGGLILKLVGEKGGVGKGRRGRGDVVSPVEQGKLVLGLVVCGVRWG